MDIQDMLARAAERLMEDESLRSRLDDQQAHLVLNRALKWLESRLAHQARLGAAPDVDQEIARAVAAMRAVNQSLGSPNAPSLSALLDRHLPLGEAGETAPAAAQNMSLVRRAASRLRSLWRRAVGKPKID